MLIDILVERSPTRRRVLTELLFRVNLVAVDGTDSWAHWVLVDSLVVGMCRCDATQNQTGRIKHAY